MDYENNRVEERREGRRRLYKAFNDAIGVTYLYDGENYYRIKRRFTTSGIVEEKSRIPIGNIRSFPRFLRQYFESRQVEKLSFRRHPIVALNLEGWRAWDDRWLKELREKEGTHRDVIRRDEFENFDGPYNLLYQELLKVAEKYGDDLSQFDFVGDRSESLVNVAYHPKMVAKYMESGEYPLPLHHWYSGEADFFHGKTVHCAVDRVEDGE